MLRNPKISGMQGNFKNFQQAENLERFSITQEIKDFQANP